MDTVFAKPMDKAFTTAIDDAAGKERCPEGATPVAPRAGTEWCGRSFPGQAGKSTAPGLHGVKNAGLKGGSLLQRRAWRLKSCSPTRRTASTGPI
jgi:hypothetical protein